MPELPEVETIRRGLYHGVPGVPSVLGMSVQNAKLFWERSLQVPSKAEFVTRLPGQTIEDIRRRGKFLIINLSSDLLLIHLRMSGDLWLEPVDFPKGPHHRFWIVFEQGWRLTFNDPRKFGCVWLVNDDSDILGKLGPEPLDPEFTPARLYSMLHSHRRQLKPLLLDQTFIAGLGNIYTDEILNLASLHPRRLSCDLTREEADRLWNAIRFVLEEGIRLNGASIDWVFRGGEFQNHFRVYGKKDQPCPRCGAPITRSIVTQRGTYTCPVCQVLGTSEQPR